MNQKEISELKRRFRLGKNAISHICGCYVNSRKEIVSYLNEPLDRMPEEEAEPQSSVQQDGGTSNGGTYGYGDMEDFFNEFFGSYSRRAG